MLRHDKKTECLPINWASPCLEVENAKIPLVASTHCRPWYATGCTPPEKNTDYSARWAQDRTTLGDQHWYRSGKLIHMCDEEKWVNKIMCRSPSSDCINQRVTLCKTYLQRHFAWCQMVQYLDARSNLDLGLARRISTCHRCYIWGHFQCLRYSRLHCYNLFWHRWKRLWQSLTSCSWRSPRKSDTIQWTQAHSACSCDSFLLTSNWKRWGTAGPCKDPGYYNTAPWSAGFGQTTLSE